MIKVVAALIKKDNKFLIARRKKGKHLEFKWEYPGGKVEDNEDEKEALKRELKEEFDISVTVGKFITESYYDYEKININLRVYMIEIFSGNFKFIDHDKIEWIKSDEFENYDFAPADIPINEYIIKNGL